MMITTPPSPAKSPMMPILPSRSFRNIQLKKPTISGMVEAMIAARDASIVCIATKFSPR